MFECSLHCSSHFSHDLEQLEPLRSQLEAAHHALKCRVALIQGPPGTGKTFIGCKLLQMFLPESRVLVLTYKNHVPSLKIIEMTRVLVIVFEKFLTPCQTSFG